MKSLAAEQRRARRIGRELSTISEASPEHIRERLLHSLLEMVEAEVAGFYSIAVDEEGRRHANCCKWIGNDAIVPLCKATLQSPEGSAGINDNNLRDYARPHRLELKAFLEDTALWEPEVILESLPFKKIVAPTGMRYQQRLLAYHGRRFLGWVGILRPRGTKPFTATDRARLQPLVQPAITALLTAERMESAAQPEEAGDVVTDPDGRVLHASRQGRAWLELLGFTEKLAAAIRVLDGTRGRQGRSIAIGNARARIVRLDGPDGVRYLAHTEPLQALTMHPDAPLAPRQRQVAHYAAAGATVREIAAALNLSSETVRSHLRDIYHRLEVANRLELARILHSERDG